MVPRAASRARRLGSRGRPGRPPYRGPAPLPTGPRRPRPPYIGRPRRRRGLSTSRLLARIGASRPRARPRYGRYSRLPSSIGLYTILSYNARAGRRRAWTASSRRPCSWPRTGRLSRPLPSCNSLRRPVLYNRCSLTRVGGAGPTCLVPPRRPASPLLLIGLLCLRGVPCRGRLGTWPTRPAWAIGSARACYRCPL